MAGEIQRPIEKQRLGLQLCSEVSHMLPYFEHYHLLEQLDEHQKASVVQHLADIFYRSEYFQTKPYPLTPDDLFCIAVALELRRSEASKTGEQNYSLLSYLNIPPEDIDRIAKRSARYLTSLLSHHEGYQAEPRLIMRQRLLPFLTPHVLKEELVVRGPRSRNANLGVKVRSTGRLDRRYGAAKNMDSGGLAVFTQGASINDTLKYGVHCYERIRVLTQTEWKRDT